MKRKAMILASAAIITVASIGGYAFAQGDNEVKLNNQDQTVVAEKLTTNYSNEEDQKVQDPVKSRDFGNQQDASIRESVTPRRFNNQQDISAQESITPRRYDSHCINSEIQTIVGIFSSFHLRIICTK